jgi:hypothetical protein
MPLLSGFPRTLASLDLTAWCLDARPPARLVEVFGGQHKILLRAVNVRPAFPSKGNRDSTLSADNRTNEELLDAVRHGAEGALAVLVERHRDRLERMVRLRMDRRLPGPRRSCGYRPGGLPGGAR